MTVRPWIAVICLWLAGCGANRIVVQTTTTQLREQDALVRAPELPLGFGASLPAGGASVSFGGGYTAVGSVDRPTWGQQVLPLAGLARGAVAAGERFELAASGSLGSPDIDLGPLARGDADRSGILARGAVGLRTFFPLDGLVEWGLSFDLGAEASHLSRTDTVVVETRTRKGTVSDTDTDVFHDLRIHPHVRGATMLRVPTAFGFTAIGGAQLQTWPAYWGARTQSDTCTRWRSGTEDCVRSGSISGSPSRLVAVLTPTVGATLNVARTDVHVQIFGNVGDGPVQDVPWGAAVTIERIIGPGSP